MTPDLIERATKAIDLFDAICNIHDPSVSAHDRRVRAMAKVLEAQLTASRAECEGLRAALDQIKKLKPSPIADTPFCTGPLLLFQAAQRIAHVALSQKETGNAA